MKIRRAGLYVRVSTEDQRTESQERQLNGICRTTRLETPQNLPGQDIWSDRFAARTG